MRLKSNLHVKGSCLMWHGFSLTQPATQPNLDECVMKNTTTYTTLVVVDAFVR